MIIGVHEFAAKLIGITPKVIEGLTTEMNRQVLELVRHIKQDKLSGQVLNRRTGALSRSIHAKPTKVTNENIVGAVASGLTVPKLDGSRVSLMAVHEFGAVITAKKAKYLRFKIDGKWIMKKQVTIPKRPVMGPALKEQAPAIDEGLSLAVNRAIL